MKSYEFFNTDFKDFSNLDNVRSIPSIIDGFKDSQRKAIYGMIKNGSQEIKVSQAAEKTSLLTHYAHGASSLADTIVGLAQSFTGSNNINLLEPVGQFGSILSPESSSHRYIFTKPSKHLPQIIKSNDECILEHRYEDNDKCEPVYFLPILPLWIVNGSVGIGTGHSVKILSRNPQSIKKLIQNLIKQKKMTQTEIDKLTTPHFNGWKGSIKSDSGKFILTGCFERLNSTTIKVTELPIGYSNDKFKSVLVNLLDSGLIKDYDNNSTEESFDFVITAPREFVKKTDEQLIKLFKLSTQITENITLWGTDGKLKRYESVYDAMIEWVEFRIKKYLDRKLTHLQMMKDEKNKQEHKMAFIKCWNELENLDKMTNEQIEIYMIKRRVQEDLIKEFMNLRLSVLTLTEIERLKKSIDVLQYDIEVLENTSVENLFVADLKGV